MKKVILFLLVAVNCISATAQRNCSNPHRIFQVPKGKVPAVIKQLGTAPEFPIICNQTDPEVYFNKLKSLGQSKEHAEHINSLFMSIGYTGVGDPRFTRDKLTKTTVPFGAIGMLGDSKHNYIYSILVLPEQNIPAWRITALSGCDLYFMNRCGNGFFYSNPPIERETIKYVERCTGTAKLNVKVMARFEETTTYECNDCEGTKRENVVSKVLALDEENIEVPITNARANAPEKVIYIDVDKATFKKLQKDKVLHDEECCGESCGDDCSGSCSEDHKAGCGNDCSNDCKH